MGAKILLVTGVAASGKTTVGQIAAQKPCGHIADGDAFRPPANVEKIRSDQPRDDADRAGWQAAINLPAQPVHRADRHRASSARGFRDFVAGF